MNKQQKHLMIAVIVGALIYFLLPEANGLTKQGISMLAVFIPTIYLWLTCGTGWTSLFSVTVAVLLNAAAGGSAYGTLWGNIVGAAVIPFLMVATVLEESGAFEWIVKWIISRRFIHGKPTLFMIMLTFAMIVISIFTAPQVVSVLFYRLLGDVTTSIGYTKEDKFYKAQGLLIGWISQLCDATLIWGRPYILSMVAVVAALGFENFTIMTYFKFAFIYLVFAVIVAIVFVKLWMRPDVSKFASFDDAAMREELKANPITKRGKIALAGMAVILLCYILASLEFLGPVATYFSGITIAASVTLVCSLLCVITVDGEPVMNLNKSAAKVPWSMIIFLGAIMFYAGAVGGEQYGITACLQSLLGPVVVKLPVMVTIVIGLIVASLATNFCSNTVSGVIICSSCIPALMAVPGISQTQVIGFACAVIAICGTSICTLSACPLMGIVFSDIGIEYKGTAKYSVAFCAVMILICAVILVPASAVLFAGMA